MLQGILKSLEARLKCSGREKQNRQRDSTLVSQADLQSVLLSF